MTNATLVYADERLASYNFGEEHPFGSARYRAFYDEFRARGLDQRCVIGKAVAADRSSIELFHTAAYVDIDAHHGNGVFYGFEEDPELIFADLHEDGRFLYPGSGATGETGKGGAAGTKLNIPMRPGADDTDFYTAWERVETHLARAEPEFIMFHCGADSIKGDPITDMAYSDEAHRYAASRLCKLADRYAGGRLLALGGGGYNLHNIAAGWNAVVEALQ